MSLQLRAKAEAEWRRRQKSGASIADTYGTFKKQYRDDPVAFVHDCIKWNGDTIAPYQDEILGRLQQRRRVSVRGPHGLGKTALSSWALLWFALTRDGEDWKAPTTASAWRQLTKFLWPEVHKWARRLKWDKIGRAPWNDRYELISLSIKSATGEAFALASNNSELIEGAHANNLLYVFDEAKVIPPQTWDSAEGAFSTGDCYWLAISTPGEPLGRFYDIHARRPGYEDWDALHITLDDAIKAGRIAEKWAEDRRRQWGEGSAVYQNRVLGEFAASDEDGVIPLSWVEASNDRWQAWSEAGKQMTFTCVGADIARSGEDKTVLALRFDKAIAELRRYTKEDTMATAGHIAGILEKYGGQAIVDVIGLGAGVVDRLREMGHEALAFNASEKAITRDSSGELGFVNKRSAAWWNLRELLDPQNAEPIALPADDLLTGDLTAPHWRVGSGGKIEVESKDEIKKRLGRSTDSGDAVMQAFYAELEDSGVDIAGWGWNA